MWEWDSKAVYLVLDAPAVQHPTWVRHAVLDLLTGRVTWLGESELNPFEGNLLVLRLGV